MNIKKMKSSQYKAKLRAYNNHIEKLREKCFGVNNRLQFIRVSNRQLNCLRWHNNETREHIIKKLDICRWLKKINHVFITEAIFINSCRADVIDLTSGIIYEILFSEKEDECNEKVMNYPDGFRIVKIKT